MHTYSWSPKALADECKGLRETFEEFTALVRRQGEDVALLSDEKWAEKYPLLTKAQLLQRNEKELDWLQSELAYFERLVTNRRAKTIWDRLETIRRTLKFQVDPDKLFTGYARSTWQLVAKCQNEAAQVPADKRDNLKKISKNIVQLKALLDKSPFMEARWLLASKISGENLQQRYFGSRYSIAVEDWRSEQLRRAESGSGRNNDAHWLLGQYLQVTVVSALDCLLEACTENANSKSIATRRSGENVHQLIYARLLFDFHKKHFGQGEHGLIVSVMNVLFDTSGETELTLEQVKGFTRSG